MRMIAFLFIIGLLCIAAGVGLIFYPAGIIALGAGLIALAVLLSRGTPPDKP